MVKPDEVFKIGYIQRPHGVRGEVDMRFTDDVFDRADADYVFLKMDGLLVPFFFEEYRFRSNEVVIVKFLDIDDADRAKALQGVEVWFEKTRIVERAEQPLSWNYLVGFRVFSDGEIVGEVTRVDASSANTLLYIRREDGGEVIVPFHEDFLTRGDEVERCLYMQLPEGLLSLND